MSLRLFAELAAPEPGVRVHLDAEESHYLRRVRRARDGARVELLDGAGAWDALVLGGDERRSEVQLLAPRPCPAPPRPLTLLLGLPEPAAALEAIAGAAELGAARIILVTCARTQGGPPSGARLARVLRASQRQCGRPSPPEIIGPTPLQAAIAGAQGARYFAWEALRGQPDRLTLAADEPAALVVGPEGGLTEAEAADLHAAGVRPLALGPWTLRTELAAIVGLTRLLFAPP